MFIVPGGYVPFTRLASRKTLFELLQDSLYIEPRAPLEQVFRGGFGFEVGPRGWRSKLSGRSARMVLTMGMPGAIFRLVFGAHGLKAITQGIFLLAGIKPSRASIVGAVDAIGAGGRARWLERMRRLGANAI